MAMMIVWHVGSGSVAIIQRDVHDLAIGAFWKVNVRDKNESHAEHVPSKRSRPLPDEGTYAFAEHRQKVLPRMRLASTIEYVKSYMRRMARRTQQSLLIQRWRERLAGWRRLPYSGLLIMLGGMFLITFLLWLFDLLILPLPNPGVVYLPLIAMLAYYWDWRLGAVACGLELLCVCFILLEPAFRFKPLTPTLVAQLLILAAASVFILLLVQLARNRRDATVREANRFAALNAVGTALSGELNEEQLLRLIARTACDLTGAGFAAFTMRPVDALGRPLVPAEGSLFHLAAVVGVTPEQEALFRRVPLGGEGLLAPIFRHGVTVRVDDALALLPATHHLAYPASQGHHHTSTTQPNIPASGEGSEEYSKGRRESPRDAARRQALSYAHGGIPASELRAVGVPRGHPIVRSFLGAPLLDREGTIRGGLLLGHTEPGHFSKQDETLLQALAAQAAVAVENARLYHAAQAQAQELNTVFESIADGVMVYDREGTLRHENRAAEQIHSLLAANSDDISGPPLAPETQTDGSTSKRVEDASRKADTANRVAENIAVSQHSQQSYTRSLTDSQGNVHEYVVVISPLQYPTSPTSLTSPINARSGAPAAGATMPGNSGARDEQSPNHDARVDHAAAAGGTVVVWHEITETRKLLAEQEARAKAEAGRLLFQQVIDELPSGAYLVLGPDARLVLANHAAQEVWGAYWAEGQTMEAFLAHSGTQMLAAGGQPLASNELATLRVLRMGEPVHQYQEIIRRPDGSTLPVLLNAVPLDAALLHDLLLPMTPGEEEHGTSVAPQPVALIVLQDVTAIKEAERLKDEFIAIAAHELKTPMAAVKGYADMLLHQTQRDAAAILASWQTEALETIDQATNRLVELTEDLLDVARLQADRLQLHLEPHDLVALARRVIKRFQLTSVQHTLSLSASEEFVVACLDVRRTEQVIGNLLSNAIKYSPNGGLIEISIEQDQAAQMARLAVHDQGIGIPANQQALLFQRFARADNARERGIAGTGLGLYLCRELVEHQGGKLWFISEEGRGSTFYLTLPLAKEE